jgi:hypothetical protein
MILSPEKTPIAASAAAAFLGRTQCRGLRAGRRPDLATPCAGSGERRDHVHAELPETKDGICVSAVRSSVAAGTCSS